MDQSMRERVEYLYPGRGEAVTRRLEVILEDFRGHDEHSKRAPRPHSESDVVLICYGDHVHHADEKTLVALDEFIRRYAAPSIPCVHILPFFPYSSDDGFSVIDYYQVKPDLGDWSDIRRIGSTVELMFDLVINHVSAQSAWFQGFLSGEPTHSDYFIAFNHPVDVSTVFRPRTHPLLTAFETAQGRRHVWTTFSSDQIDVNFANPDVLLAYIRILLFYVHQGAGVIRLDAIAYLWKELGTSSLHLPQTHAVVKLLRQILDDVAPDVWIITETNVPHKDNVSYFSDGHDEAHLVYNFALPPLLLHTLLSGDASALSAWAKMLESPSEDTTFFNFTASHDGIGVTPLRGLVSEDQFQRVVDSVRERGGRVNFRTVPGQEPVPYELNIVYLDAVGGVEPFLASQAIALALRGVPAIYFNSLIGARNWTEGVERLGYNRAINREKFDLPALSAELDTAGTEKHRIHQALTHQIQVRRREPLFSPAAGQTVVNLDPRVFALLRTRGEDRLLAVTSVTAEIATVDGTRLATELGRKSARDVLTDHQVPLTKSVRLEPYQTLWLREA